MELEVVSGFYRFHSSYVFLSTGSSAEWFLGSGCSSQVILCLISKQHGMSEVGGRAETGSRLPSGSLPSSSPGVAAGAVEGSVSLLFLMCRVFRCRSLKVSAFFVPLILFCLW